MKQTLLSLAITGVVAAGSVPPSVLAESINQPAGSGHANWNSTTERIATQITVPSYEILISTSPVSNIFNEPTTMTVRVQNTSSHSLCDVKVRIGFLAGPMAEANSYFIKEDGVIWEAETTSFQEGHEKVVDIGDIKAGETSKGKDLLIGTCSNEVTKARNIPYKTCKWTDKEVANPGELSYLARATGAIEVEDVLYTIKPRLQLRLPLVTSLGGSNQKVYSCKGSDCAPPAHSGSAGKTEVVAYGDCPKTKTTKTKSKKTPPPPPYCICCGDSVNSSCNSPHCKPQPKGFACGS